jgi:hypothetical protein
MIRQAIGLTDFFVPGEDDRNHQYDEIKLLVDSEPMPNPMDPMNPEVPSVDVDPLMENHAIEFEICRKWAISPAGQQCKMDNEPGYRNVLLHAKLHYMFMQQNAMMQQSQAPGNEKGIAPPEKPNQLEMQDTPIQGEGNVNAVQ